MRSRRPVLEGDRGVIVLQTMPLVPSSVKVSLFHSAWLDLSGHTTVLTHPLAEGQLDCPHFGARINKAVGNTYNHVRPFFPAGS